MLTALLEFDHKLFFAINNGLGASASAVLDPFMLLVSSHSFWVVVAIAFLAYGTLRRSRKIFEVFFFAGVAIGLADLVSYQVFKPSFARLRPCHEFKEQVRLAQPRCGGDFGFPSNHAANGAAATGVILLFLSDRRRAATVASLVIIPVIVGLSRIHIGVHYPGDILFGFLVGSVIAVTLVTTYRRYGGDRIASLLGRVGLK